MFEKAFLSGRLTVGVGPKGKNGKGKDIPTTRLVFIVDRESRLWLATTIELSPRRHTAFYAAMEALRLDLGHIGGSNADEIELEETFSRPSPSALWTLYKSLTGAAK